MCDVITLHSINYFGEYYESRLCIQDQYGEYIPTEHNDITPAGK